MVIPTYILGLLYYGGKVVKQDYNQCLKYFNKLVNPKTSYSNEAKVMLGIMYFIGHSVEENNIKDYEYWTDAYKEGNILAKLILEYDDFKIYTKKISNIKILASKDETFESSINYIYWIRSDKGKKFVYKTTMSLEEIDKNMLRYANMAFLGIDFAVTFTSAYLMSIGAIKESVEIYDHLPKNKKAK